jgi:hypothetical protein
MHKPTTLLLFRSANRIRSKKLHQTLFSFRTNWEQKTPADLRCLTPLKCKEAIEIAKAAETKNPRNMEINHYRTFGKEPFGEGIGPFEERGDATGIIVYKGYIIATWGEPAALRYDA